MWIGLSTAVLGGGGIAALTNFMNSYLRERSASTLAANQQPIDHYNQLVSRLDVRISTLETANRECMEHHSKCERQVGEMTGRIDELRQQIQLLNPPKSPVNVLVKTTERLDSIEIIDKKDEPEATHAHSSHKKED